MKTNIFNRIVLSLLVVGSIVSTIIFLGSQVNAVEPFGASFTVERTERAPNDTAQDDEALAGNVTEITITGFTITQTWQGYFGNITGSITLDDGSGNTLYDWAADASFSPIGEIYAANAPLR